MTHLKVVLRPPGCVGSGRRLLRATLLAAAAVPACAWAADAPSGSAPVIEEVVVTATRRSEDIQKVPMSVTAYSAQELTTKNITRLEDVLTSAPNVSFSGTGGGSSRYSTLSIRGISGTDEESAVGVYIDNVYVGRRIAQNMDFLDPGSIQVLRGPQGTLYGKNTLGGAIIVETRKPSTEKVEGFAEARLGNYLHSLKGSVSAPLADGWAVLLGGRVSDSNGYQHNIATGETLGDAKTWGALAALRYVGDRLEFNLNGDYSRDDNDGAFWHAVRFHDPFAFLPHPPTPAIPFVIGPNQAPADAFSNDVAVNGPRFERRDVHGLTGRVDYDFGAFSLKSTTGWRGFTSKNLADIDGTSVSLFTVKAKIKQNQYSEELTLISNPGTRFEWLVGASFYKEHFVYIQDSYDYVGRVTGNLPGLLAGVLPSDTFVNSNQKSDSYAAYAQGRYHLTDALSVTAGLRYAYDKRSSDKSQTSLLLAGTAAQFQPCNFPGKTPATLVPPCSNPVVTSDSGSWHDLLPELVVQYEFNPEVSAYAKLNKSYRPGGFSPQRTGLAPSEFQREQAWSYEAGLRTRVFDGRGNINLTGFYTKWKGQQVQTLGPGSTFQVSNDDAAVAGAELETRFRLTSEWQVGLSAAWLPKAEYKGGPGQLLTIRDPVTAAAFNAPAKGLRMARAAKTSASAFAEYERELGNGATLDLRADLSYRSKELVQSGYYYLFSPEYTELNLRAAYSDRGVTFALWGRNLFNDRYANYGLSQSYADTVNVSEPRTYGATLTYRY